MKKLLPNKFFLFMTSLLRPIHTLPFLLLGLTLSCQFQDPEVTELTGTNSQGRTRNSFAITATNGSINTVNQSVYSMAGTCSEQSSLIKMIIGPLSNSTSCNAGTFGFVIDLSGAGDGTFTFYFEEALSSGKIYKTNYTATKDTTSPIVNPIPDDDVPVSTKTLIWGCNEYCSYRYSVSTSIFAIPIGVYSAINQVTVNTGVERYYLHVQAMDAAGNESAVETGYFFIDQNLPAPMMATPSLSSISNSSLESSSLTNIIFSFTSGQNIFITGDQIQEEAHFNQHNFPTSDISFKIETSKNGTCRDVNFSTSIEHSIDSSILLNVANGSSATFCLVSKDQFNIWRELESQIKFVQVYKGFPDQLMTSYSQASCPKGWELVAARESMTDTPPIKKHCRLK